MSVNLPPNDDIIDKRERPSGKLDKLVCKKCRRTLSLRDVNMTGNTIKCKKCGMIVLEIKD